MEDKRDDHWGTLNKKQQLIVTDVMKKRPYTSKGNRSYTRLYDFDGNYYTAITWLWRSADFLEEIFKSLEADGRFKTFGFKYDTDTKLYQFEINNYKGGYLSSSDKRLIDAVINTVYQMLINMRREENDGG
ncbi:hypothetical protein [Bacillus atrophaeus]|uniref:hypothetical protein n=1 Tax=Bacillus atrophaeus TaxID=1452 RepID=UPI002E1EAB42|nr:hypothetical protein [Bacillus atrophaeus]MED4823272.1 hypothetical protein [Bacillus atrophaeus]MED4842823.1 hypothetical protein [Bacillus atrophaeus]